MNKLQTNELKKYFKKLCIEENLEIYNLKLLFQNLTLSKNLSNKKNSFQKLFNIINLGPKKKILQEKKGHFNGL